MATKTTKAAAEKANNLLDNSFVQSLTSVGYRFANVTLDLAQNTTQIAATASYETIGNLREVYTPRTEFGAYANAYTDLVKKQFDLTSRSVKSLGEAASEFGSKAKDIATDAGEQITDTVSANVNAAAEKVSETVSDAADKVSSATKSAA
ncbi:hypothetical protein [Palleronia caenipelagi]|uniref:Phasin family protein n=1 Tax=Palleronia caenipelagi TaxID=2489174 RepID=A0A547Q6H5_9RHOB|nr:hypothetical protein [Palleronia caenipelagi]TRD21964.1 hypothetical protein FEV53_06200 [Palleronia caenipelagi]